MAKKVTFVNGDNMSQFFKVNLFGPEKNRVKVANVLTAFESSMVVMDDGSVMEADEDGLSMDVFIADGTYTLLVRPEGGPSPNKRNRSAAVDLETEIAEQSRYIKALLAPPDKLPIEVADLHEFLSQISRPLPVLFQEFVSVSDPMLVKLSSPAEQNVATCVGSACKAFRERPDNERPDNEADSSHKLRCVTGDFLLQLDSLASSEQQLLSLRTTMDSSMKRPDFALYIWNALILRWENKFDPAGFGTALGENVEKLKVWSYLYYGNLPYVIGGCCGGRLFQWLRLAKKDTGIVAEHISEVYDLWTEKGVGKVLHSVVQMHRLLQKLQKRLSEVVPITLYKEIERPNRTVSDRTEQFL